MADSKFACRVSRLHSRASLGSPKEERDGMDEKDDYELTTGVRRWKKDGMDDDSNLRPGTSRPDDDSHEDTAISLHDLVEYLHVNHRVPMDRIFLHMPDGLAIVDVTVPRASNPHRDLGSQLEVMLSDKRRENSDFSTWLRRGGLPDEHPRNGPNKRPEAGSHRPRQGSYRCLGIGPLLGCSHCRPGSPYLGVDPEVGR